MYFAHTWPIDRQCINIGRSQPVIGLDEKNHLLLTCIWYIYCTEYVWSLSMPMLTCLKYFLLTSRHVDTGIILLILCVWMWFNGGNVLALWDNWPKVTQWMLESWRHEWYGQSTFSMAKTSTETTHGPTASVASTVCDKICTYYCCQSHGADNSKGYLEYYILTHSGSPYNNLWIGTAVPQPWDIFLPNGISYIKLLVSFYPLQTFLA